MTSSRDPTLAGHWVVNILVTLGVTHITLGDKLTSYLTSAFGSGSYTVLLFLQDKLSKDDFTVFGGVFGDKTDSAFQNVEAALEASSSSVILPAVEWSSPAAVSTWLQEKLAVSPLLVDTDAPSHLSISSSGNNLLLVKLPYCTNLHKSCKATLQNNDKIIGEVLSAVKAKNAPYTAIYTGRQPSRMISEALVSNHGVGRSLLQTVGANVKSPIMYNSTGSPCIMLWAENLYVSLHQTTNWTDVATQVPSLSGSQCNGSHSHLVLAYPSGITLSFSMSVQFYPVSARNWFTLDSVELEFNGEVASFIGSRGIYAPSEYSFHCQSVTSFEDALLVPNTTTGNSSMWKLNFVDFQIQGFGLANGTDFSYASDCAGFFTPAIWMGLVTVLLMLLIFAYGMHMLMHLNTMDRFDDPKGPSISVPQSE
ncbi:V-type proton ATPase subunit S1b isoform X2 [Thalassophryne amazonica]|uniref:V-type proton ATPase subunit S1b isoform X2 n=1 Tax=Thalassophryne amazonica TaxID=390379 RepID=UPI001471B452|nr:V-type proton ATPase subunit S1b isoform X2 [Thalassophryne amazonica]